jgi:2-keto-4-pentenoate hydratase/2-oxohepta-3-ene-1,7-dioic acid hydratase in catechol pathway
MPLSQVKLKLRRSGGRQDSRHRSQLSRPREGNRARAPTTQMWFNKQSTCLHGPFDPVLMPAVSTALDYEVELVVVIGKRGRHVPRERAHEIIAGT